MKFGTLDDHGNPIPYSHPHVFMERQFEGGVRLDIAPNGLHSELMLALSDVLPEPFWILYVLLIPHKEFREGRYQSTGTTDRAGLRVFFENFGEFFEQDGRHHVWVSSAVDNSLIVYDQHNYIAAYGPLDRYKKVCTQRGLIEKSFSLPVPHVHMYPPNNHPRLESLMTLSWKHFELKPGEDDPE